MFNDNMFYQICCGKIWRKRELSPLEELLVKDLEGLIRTVRTSAAARVAIARQLTREVRHFEQYLTGTTANPYRLDLARMRPQLREPARQLQLFTKKVVVSLDDLAKVTRQIQHPANEHCKAAKQIAETIACFYDDPQSMVKRLQASIEELFSAVDTEASTMVLFHNHMHRIVEPLLMSSDEVCETHIDMTSLLAQLQAQLPSNIASVSSDRRRSSSDPPKGKGASPMVEADLFSLFCIAQSLQLIELLIHDAMEKTEEFLKALNRVHYIRAEEERENAEEECPCDTLGLCEKPSPISMYSARLPTDDEDGNEDVGFRDGAQSPF